MEVLGRFVNVVENAVDAKAHLHELLKGFDVNVRGFVFDRAKEERVDEANDRRFVVGGLQKVHGLVEVGVVVIFARLEAFDHVVRTFEDHVDGVVEALGQGDHGFDLLFVEDLQSVEGFVVKGVCHGDAYEVVGLVNGQDFVLAAILDGQTLYHGGVDLLRFEVFDKGQAELHRKGLGDVLRAHKLLLDQDFTDFFAALFLDEQNLRQVLFFEAGVLDEEIPDSCF